MMLVSLQAASDYVRRDGDDDDDLLTVLIEAASAAVVNYLGSQAETVLGYDSDGEPVLESSDGIVADVPAVVRMATLYLTAWMYRNRDQNADEAFQPGYLPAPVTAMLYALRDPVIA